MPPVDARQFAALYRLSLSRVIDLEILASKADTGGVFARFGGTLLALSFTLVLLIVVPLALHGASPGVSMWNNEEFLISLTLALCGLLSVIAWNNILPDRRDCLVLGTLPVSTATIALSRLAAIVTCLLILIGLLNAFTALTFPLILAQGFWHALRSLAAWLITLVAAGLFAFAWTLAVQGAAAQIFRWNTFLRISGVLQLICLALAIGLFFLTPALGQSLGEDSWLLSLMPSYWFTGLFHLLRGDATPELRNLGIACLRDGLLVTVFAGSMFALSWSRHMRTIVESPEIASLSGRTWLARCGTLLVDRFLRRPLDRAILLFTARTIARSRQHRLLLAVYFGVGLALAGAFSKSLIVPMPGFHHGDFDPITPLLDALLLLLCAIIAIRAIFVLPQALSANWIFRITAVHSPARYFNAVRKSMLVLSVAPVWIVCAGAYFALLPGRIAIGGVAVLILLGLIATDRGLREFRKIPFACSWLPADGQSTATVKALGYAVLFLVFATVLTALQLWAIEGTARLIVLLACLSFWAMSLRRQGLAFAGAQGNSVQFDHQPEPLIFALDLRPDGEWSGDQAYVDAIDTGNHRTPLQRLRRIAIVLSSIVALGFVYEKASQWRDHREFPQIGKSFDIGGRSLNLNCAGQGTPPVIMDSGGNQPGYVWTPVQREVSAFTRACWYDRAGYGWSDPASGSHTSADIAEDLHKLLHAAGIQPPYVLVGHSFGGFNVRVFAAHYPAETAGLILADSASENDDEIEIPAEIRAPGDAIPLSLRRPLTTAMSFLAHTGVERLIEGGLPPTTGGAGQQEFLMLRALGLQAKTFDATAQEGLDRPASMRQVKAVRSVGSIPLIVLTAGGRSSDHQGSESLRNYMQFRIYKDQPRMLALSTRSRQIILKSGHDIPREAPHAVTQAIHQLPDIPLQSR